ncbi:hypothetical protein OF83DRAFT_1062782 [Amylostereum chailletii]|nr:hypothetical protein OF83DRAFT_1062782 [Amylostereum chailletii]
MDSILESQRTKTTKKTCNYGDWQELKEWFAEAAEQYERDETAAAIALLRAVIRECHRILTFYPDPSVLFAPRPSPRRTANGTPPDTNTPVQELFPRDWSAFSQTTTLRPSPIELPTAFHAILGITLFLFGNLVGQDSSLVLSGEPDVPTTYWLAALDVFETGENLPCRTSGNTFDVEDWRMAIVWGRTLICLAEEKITLMARAGPDSTSFSARIPVAEPRWPRDSIFHDIAARRPPVTRRMSLATATPNDLMVLAMDQFSRGIFHMPHPEYAHSHSHIFARNAPSLPLLPQTLNPASPDSLGFSRPKELFTIASEVIGVAERLRDPDERKYWAIWADSVFNQMKMEADTGEWRSRIISARGRCWLVAGSVRVDDLEDALERGDDNVYTCKEAVEAREDVAVSFFERAKGSASGYSMPELQELQPLFTEALLSLANLTADESEREELYSRAQAEGGDTVVLNMDRQGEITSLRDNTSSEQIVYMDES